MASLPSALDQLALDGVLDPARYLMNFAASFAARLLDVASTRYVTKTMKLETNPLVRRVGLKGMVALQLPAALVGGLDWHFAFFLFVWSVMIAGSNLEGSWYVRHEGEEEYRRRLVRAAKDTPLAKIVLGELNSLTSLVLGGTLVVWFSLAGSALMAAFVGLAMACHGAVHAWRSISFVNSLRRAADAQENSEGDASSGGSTGISIQRDGSGESSG